MWPRFHLPAMDTSGYGELDSDEAGHLTRVLRLGVGAEIDVFDGRGGMFHARVVGLDRARVRVQVVSPVPCAPEPLVRVTLVMSALKGDKFDDVVRDTVMMGVTAVQPVITARSEVGLTALARGERVERWRRIAVSSVKQCGRATLTVVHSPVALQSWLATRPGESLIVLTEPGAADASGFRQVPRADAVALMVGPEGGWSPEEITTFSAAGAHAVSLGGRTLRADAAPLVAMAALYEAWQGW